MKRSILTLAIIPMLLLIGCTPSERDDIVVDSDTLGVTGQDQMAQDDMMNFRADVDENLSEIDARLDSLELYAANAAEDVSVEINSAVAELREKRDSVQMEVQQLDLANEDRIDSVRMDIESELNELESDVETAWERFRDEDVIPDAS